MTTTTYQVDQLSTPETNAIHESKMRDYRAHLRTITNGLVEMAKAAGLQICTLGSRILRCETAPLCALSAVMYASGEF